MKNKVLLTSFDVWEAHHKSNASDDLLDAILEQSLLAQNHYFLRKIPVDFQLAPETVLATIATLQPDLIICCGMAERRSLLTLESTGKGHREILKTSINLDLLIEKTIATKISHDAGNFVCNHLYYSVLKHIQTTASTSQCLFVHVPLLNADNLNPIIQDFLKIVTRINQLDRQTVTQSTQE
jgi:pyroglutamyl-peptidase